MTREHRTCSESAVITLPEKLVSAPGTSPPGAERLRVVVRGTVQGVGFRPFVHNLAVRLALGGSVRNESGSVVIEVEGAPASLRAFLDGIDSSPPPLASVDEVEVAWLRARGQAAFRIEASSAGALGDELAISPDVATCADCLAELWNPGDRRYRYPFINCTQCGPRLTIVRASPYDRERTTMSGFAMCAACRAEYENPADRRFHAEPIACPVCGPQLAFWNRGGRFPGDALAAAVEALALGAIVAVKGLGGYHLSCDATDAGAVDRLRRRKGRDDKPFAVLVANLREAEAVCALSSQERELLGSRRAPIVLARRRDGGALPLASGVAPDNPLVGLMLPYTPLHHLLVREAGGPLVMTSANRAGEPIVFTDEEAKQRLAHIADGWLVHDRPIHLRCDDSVVKLVAGTATVLRRSRGHAPEPMRLPVACPKPVLALGGHLKNTFALARGRHAIVSHHIGDLDDHSAIRAFRDDVAHYAELYGFEPEVIAHDAHPSYATSVYARDRAAAGIPCIAVQHHHAHMASCMVEHGLSQPVIGVTFDGSGYGTNGTIWGGEFLVGDYARVSRAAHVRPVPLPGGDKAIREPWRMLVSHLVDAGIDPEPVLAGRVAAAELRIVRRMIERRINAPVTSSAGRLFDAAAALLGVRDRVSFEAQAAAELEWLAESSTADAPYPFTLDRSGDSVVVDTRPLWRAMSAARFRERPADAARRFHLTLAEIIAQVAGRVAETTGIAHAVLSGGVFVNSILSREARRRLERRGLRVLSHSRVPPGDGGLSLGQLAVAAASLQGGR